MVKLSVNTFTSLGINGHYVILYYKNIVTATLTCPHIHNTSMYCACVDRKAHTPAQKSSVIHL